MNLLIPLTFLCRNVGMKEIHPAKLRQKMHIRKQKRAYFEKIIDSFIEYVHLLLVESLLDKE